MSISGFNDDSGPASFDRSIPTTAQRGAGQREVGFGEQKDNHQLSSTKRRRTGKTLDNSNGPTSCIILDEDDDEEVVSPEDTKSPEVKKTADLSIWASFTYAETRRLTRKRWVNDKIISTILNHAAAAAAPSACLVLTPYQLAQKESGPSSPMSGMLERALLVDAVDRDIVVVANLSKIHWVVIRLVLQAHVQPQSQANDNADADSDASQPKSLHRCELYDSMQPTSPDRLQEARDIAGRVIRNFLPQSYHALETNWDLTMDSQSCAQQINSDDYGIYALVTVWHLLFLPVDQSLPVEVNVSVWHAVFTALGGSDADQGIKYLPSAMAENLEDGASSFAGAQQKEDQDSENSLSDRSSPLVTQSRTLSAAAAKLNTVHQELASSISYWERREEEAIDVVKSARYDIGPLVDRWLNHIEVASDRAENEVSKLDDQGKQLNRILSDLGTGEGQGIAAHIKVAAFSI